MKLSIVCLYVFLLLFPASEARAAPLIIVHGDASNPIVKVARLIVEDIYARMGLEVLFVGRPLKRALSEANEGKFTAEVARVKGLEEQYPNLIRIPVPIYHIEGVSFTKGKEFMVSGWESLSPYKIGVLRGVQFAEKGTEGFDRCSANSLVGLFKLLDLGRIDVVVEAKLNGRLMVKQLNLQDSTRILSPPLMTLDLYHYVHKRNEKLAEDLTELMIRMKENGALEELIRRSEQAVIDSFSYESQCEHESSKPKDDLP